MFECNCCGKRFHQPSTLAEERGEAAGRPCFEQIRSCPRCGGSFTTINEKKMFYKRGV